MSDHTEAQKKLWLDFAVPRINLYHGQSAVASLLSVAYAGLGKAAADLARDIDKFNLLNEPHETDASDDASDEPIGGQRDAEVET